MPDFQTHNLVHPTGSTIDVTFDNRGDRLIGLGFLNGLLKVLTLGLYSFWGKTEVRKRLWSFTKLNGEPLEYTGTGKELFLGFLVAFFGFVLPLMLGGALVVFLFPGSEAALGLYQIAAYGLFFLLLGNALYRAQRYRLSRTRWRAIHGGMEGSAASYGWTYFWTLALPFGLVAALGAALSYAGQPSVAAVLSGLGFIAALWVLPWRSNMLQRQLTNDMRFGDAELSYSGASRPLYKRYFFAWASSAVLYILAIIATAGIAANSGLVGAMEADPGEVATPIQMPDARVGLGLLALWLLVMFAVGLITAWYRAYQMNHFARHTHLGTANFTLKASGKGLMWLLFSNWLISILGALVGLAVGAALVYQLGLLPQTAVEGVEPAESGFLPVVLLLLPIVLFTTLTTTFAQFRSARYFLSRLKLDGPVDLARIQQSTSTGPKRGEGLAQVFDLDAF